MTLLETIRNDMFEAKKNGHIDKSIILGMAVSAINNYKIETQKDLTEQDYINVLRKEEKKLKDAHQQYLENGSNELANKEKLQLEVIQAYLPSLMSYEEVEKFVDNEIKNMGTVSMQDMGKVMGMMMGKLKGQADGNDVSSAVKKILSQM